MTETNYETELKKARNAGYDTVPTADKATQTPMVSTVTTGTNPAPRLLASKKFAADSLAQRRHNLKARMGEINAVKGKPMLQKPGQATSIFAPAKTTKEEIGRAHV